LAIYVILSKGGLPSSGISSTFSRTTPRWSSSGFLAGTDYIRGYKVERIYREVGVNAIGGGSEEIMRDLAARQMKL